MRTVGTIRVGVTRRTGATRRVGVTRTVVVGLVGVGATLVGPEDGPFEGREGFPALAEVAASPRIAAARVAMLPKERGVLMDVFMVLYSLSLCVTSDLFFSEEV